MIHKYDHNIYSQKPVAINLILGDYLIFSKLIKAYIF